MIWSRWAFTSLAKTWDKNIAFKTEDKIVVHLFQPVLSKGRQHHSVIVTLCSSIWERTVFRIRLGGEAMFKFCSARVSQLINSCREFWNSVARLRASSSFDWILIKTHTTHTQWKSAKFRNYSFKDKGVNCTPNETTSKKEVSFNQLPNILCLQRRGHFSVWNWKQLYEKGKITICSWVAFSAISYFLGH